MHTRPNTASPKSKKVIPKDSTSDWASLETKIEEQARKLREQTENNSHEQKSVRPKTIMDVVNRKSPEKRVHTPERPVSPNQQRAAIIYNKYLSNQQKKQTKVEEAKKQLEEKRKLEKKMQQANIDAKLESQREPEAPIGPLVTPVFSVQVNNSTKSMSLKELEKIKWSELRTKQQQQANALANQIEQSQQLKNAQASPQESPSMLSLGIQDKDVTIKQRSRELAVRNQEENKQMSQLKEEYLLKTKEKERVENEEQLRRYLEILEMEQQRIEQEKLKAEAEARRVLKEQIQQKAQVEQQYFDLSGKYKASKYK